MKRSLLGTLLVVSVILHALFFWGSAHWSLSFRNTRGPALRDDDSFSATVEKREVTYPVSTKLMIVPPLSPPAEPQSGQPKVEIASVTMAGSVSLKSQDTDADLIPAGPLPKLYSLPSGQSVVFLLDQSGSMFEPVAGTTRARLAMGQLFKWLDLVGNDNLFNIVLYARKVLTFQPTPITVSPTERKNARNFLRSENDCGGTTEFLAGLEAALNNKPDTILIITDGDLNLAPYVVLRGARELRQRLSPSTRINVLGVYVRPATGAADTLARLARENDGQLELWPSKDGES